MRHLKPETLARIADGPATEDEVAHLDACAECRDEVAALSAQTEALAALRPPPVPPAVWEGVRARLAGEVRPAAEGPRSRIRGAAGRRALQAAAAVALFAAGTFAGAALGEGGGSDVARAPGEDPASVPWEPAADDPATRLREAEDRYLDALSRWTEAGGALPTVDPVGRLAAMESILHTTRAALDRTPEDPLLTGFYRTALTQREAILQRVDMTEEEEWF